MANFFLNEVNWSVGCRYLRSKNLYMDLYMAELFHMFLTTPICKFRTVLNDVFTNIG